MSDNRAVTAKLSRVDKAAILLLSLGETDAATLHGAPHPFFAIWRGPDAAAIIRDAGMEQPKR